MTKWIHISARSLIRVFALTLSCLVGPVACGSDNSGITASPPAQDKYLCQMPKYADRFKPSNWSATCRQCAADADLPKTRITRNSLYEIRNGVVWKPQKNSWYRRPNAEILFGGVLRVYWDEIDTTNGIEFCEKAGQYAGPSYGRMLHRAGRLDEAAEVFKSLYERNVNRTSHGMSSVATHLARMYEMGWGLPRDLARAKELYEAAATQGETYIARSDTYFPANPRAQQNFAAMLYWGSAGESDVPRAAAMWQQASQKFQAHSLANLAWLHRRGKGVRKNHKKSADLYLEAIRLLSMQEDSPNMFLGNENRFGSDLDMADVPLDWLNAAAEQNQREALATLGYMFHAGKAVPTNLETALDFYERAIRLYPHSPEYGTGPAFADEADAQPGAAAPSWIVDLDLLDDGLDSADPFGLVYQAIHLERKAKSAATYDLDLLKRAAEAYAASGLGYAGVQSAKILAYLATAYEEGSVTRSELYQQAEERLAAAMPLESNYAALSDRAAILYSTGRTAEAIALTRASAQGIEGDSLYPDARALLMNAIIYDAKGLTSVDSSHVRVLLRKAKSRALYSRDFRLISVIEETEEFADKNLAERLAVERQLFEEREAQKKVLSIILVLLMLSGMGGGDQQPGGFMDQADGMQHAGTMIMMGI